MKKESAKILALLLAALMLLSVLTACGKKDDGTPAGGSQNDTQEANGNGEQDTAAQEPETEAPETQPAEITGTTTAWGNYTVLVPEGFELAEAGEFSAYDFSVRKSSFSCFDFNTEDDDELLMTHYDYNKNTYTNEQVDVEATCGENHWIGFQYSDGFGGYGFEAYTTIEGKLVRISGIGFTFDSPEAQAVLASLTAK